MKRPFSTAENYTTNNLFRKTLLASAFTIALAAATSSAMAQTATTFPDFTVNEGSIAGATARTFDADKITGNYVEVITFADVPASGTFNVSLKWNAGHFVGNDGKDPVNSQLGGISAN